MLTEEGEIDNQGGPEKNEKIYNLFSGVTDCNFTSCRSCLATIWPGNMNRGTSLPTITKCNSFFVFYLPDLPEKSSPQRNTPHTAPHRTSERVCPSAALLIVQVNMICGPLEISMLDGVDLVNCTLVGDYDRVTCFIHLFMSCSEGDIDSSR